MESQKIYDVIYEALTKKERTLILTSWPDAKFENTYDEIHENRTVVTLDASQEEWFEFLIQEELTTLSLLFQFESRSNPTPILKLLKRLKKEEPQ